MGGGTPNILRGSGGGGGVAPGKKTLNKSVIDLFSSWQ